MGKSVAIIGGGPAGLMAAEVLACSGVAVEVFDSMPTLGRKFLRAGLGGLNITHSESFDSFCSRYGERQKVMQEFLDRFRPEDFRQWVHQLGIDTFVGSSGRVFPKEMKAAPLLRAWVHRLRSSGVRFYQNHRWQGFGGDGSLVFEFGDQIVERKPDATVLALGGASWPQLGSTGTWSTILKDRGVEIEPFQAANCSFDIPWSEHMRERFKHVPLKAVSLTFTDIEGVKETRDGELLVTDYGVEGSLIYWFSKRLRDSIVKRGEAVFYLDLLPGRSLEGVTKVLSKPRGSRSLSRHLQTCLGDNALKRALVFEFADKKVLSDSNALARIIKSLPVRTSKVHSIEDAISTAGGITFDSVDKNLMLKKLPAVFVAGEMLDWEAPTGGYLLTAVVASGRWAGNAVVRYLSESTTT
jgi:uncharacterized flavoprotein (TIGR03862 family)